MYMHAKETHCIEKRYNFIYVCEANTTTAFYFLLLDLRWYPFRHWLIRFLGMYFLLNGEYKENSHSSLTADILYSSKFKLDSL